jgi:RHS repeat-associated protein
MRRFWAALLMLSLILPLAGAPPESYAASPPPATATLPAMHSRIKVDERSIMALPIPTHAKQQLQARLATGGKNNAAASDSGSCADASLNNVVVLSPGQSCSVQEADGNFLGGCAWNTAGSDPQVNVVVSPTVIPSGGTGTFSFTAPGNNTQVTQEYTAEGTCGPFTIVDYTVQVPPMPERNCARCNQTSVGNPVDVADGEDFYQYTDVSFAGPFGLSFKRSYASLTQVNGSATLTTAPASDLGNNWRHNYTQRLDLSQSGSIAFYDETSLPTYFNAKPAAGGAAVYESISGMQIALNSTSTTYTVTSFDNRKWVFNTKGELTSLSDRIGNTQTLTRDATTGHNDRILSVADPLSRKMCFFYDTNNRITELSWLGSGSCPASAPSTGTIVKYTYDSGTNCTTGQLCAATEPDGKTWTYQYTISNTAFPNDLAEVDDPLGDPEEVNTYSGYQVLTQHTGKCTGTFPCADTGGDLTFTYPNVGVSTAATVVDGLGRTSTLTYDPNTYLLLQIVGPLCNCGGDQTRAYTFDAYERMQTQTDDGTGGTATHTFTYTYGRDNGTTAYPGPTKIVENLDASGTTRTTTLTYYAIGDARQDLPEKTTLPSVDKGGTSTMSISDTYSTAGLLTSRVKTGFINGVSTSYTWGWKFDSRGRVLQAIGPRNSSTFSEVTNYAYFSDTDSLSQRAGQLKSITDALGHVTNFAAYTGFTNYSVFADPQSMTDPNGVVTEYTYDARGRKLTSTLLGVTGDSANLVTTWTYDAAGRMTSLQKPLKNGVSLSFDTSNRTTAATRTDAAGLQHEQLAFAYNVNDQVSQRNANGCKTPASSCSSWVATWTAGYNYAPATSNLSSISNPDGTSKSFTYIPSGAVGTINDENHPTGSDYTYTYDVAGRRLQETRFLTGSSTGVITKYSYDLHDNVTSVTDPNGNVTTYHYDDFDRVTKETSPVQGVTTYAYDQDSNLLSTTDANGATSAYKYDALNRVQSETSTKTGSTTLITTWTYDDATAGHFGIGRLATMTDPSGSSAYTYERRGNVAVENRIIVGNAFTQAYTYDGNMNRATITYPDGYVVTTGYDYADRPSSSSHTSTLTSTQLAALSASGLAAPANTATPEFLGRRSGNLAAGTLPVGSRAANRYTLGSRVQTGPRTAAAVHPLTVSSDSFVTAATYKPFGPIATVSFGNGTTQTLSWNNRYFPTQNELTATATLANYTYTEDGVGNIKTITDAVNAGYDRTFAYDDLNRLTTANGGTSLWGTASGNGYTYDPMGNIKTRHLGSGKIDLFTYKAGTGSSVGLPQIANTVENGTTRTVTYDAFGNETNDSESTFTYSPRELLGTDSRFISAYYYDGFRKRVATKLSSNANLRDSFFDGTRLLAETDQFTTAAPTIAYKYVWLGNRPVAQVDAGGTHWTFADHLGTPLAQTSSAAAITYQVELEPYGKVYKTRTGGTLHQPLRFPGQTAEQFDSGDNGLTERSYNNARWYRPQWGRYTQPDPLGALVTFQLYTYSHDHALETTDPSGLIPIDPITLPAAPFVWSPGGDFQIKIHGQFCGPGYAFGYLGKSETDYPPSAYDHVPDGPDALDNCCKRHDRCHSQCHQDHPFCLAAEKSCKCGCDKKLGACAGKSPQIARLAIGALFPPDGSGGPSCPSGPPASPPNAARGL